MSYILLWLEAPMQAWGVDSRFGRRDTLPFPTRSGIMGMLCAASGKGGEQREWLAHMAGRSQVVDAYAYEDAQGKAKRWPLLCDFHMVGSAYDAKDPWQTMLIPKKSDGGKAVGGGTKLTYRYYLQDMAFACALEVPDGEADELAAALCAPVWAISLGRKCCVPTDTVYRGTYATEEEALAEGERIAQGKKRVSIFRVLDGADAESGDVMTLNDVPICFGTRKQYRDRQVTMVYGTLDADE